MEFDQYTGKSHEWQYINNLYKLLQLSLFNNNLSFCQNQEGTENWWKVFNPNLAVVLARATLSFLIRHLPNVFLPKQN